MRNGLESKFEFPAVDSFGHPIPEDLRVESGQDTRRQIMTELPWRQVAGVKGRDRDGKVRDVLQLNQVGEFAVASTRRGVSQFAYLHAVSDPEHPGVNVSAVVVRPTLLNRVRSLFGAEVEAATTFVINLPVIKNEVELALNK